MSAELAQLIERAIQSGRCGRDDESDRLWRKVIDHEPRHTQALSNLGTNALARGDIELALDMLEAARLTAPTDLVVLMALAEARRLDRDADGEFQALQWALAVDPSYLPALLAKGAWFENRGRSSEANETYEIALRFAGPSAAWSSQLRSELEAAADFLERYAKRLHGRLRGLIADRSTEAGRKERWQEAASTIAGRSRPFVALPARFRIPRLPAVPFFDPNAVPGLAELGRHIEEIRIELARLLERGLFDPAIALPLGEPVGPWEELNHSARWCAFRLWEDGVAIEENVRRCPKTTSLLRGVELCDLPGFGPDVCFAMLAPQTGIPPHHGKTNARAIVHLPVIAPRPCHLRVGFENRQWREGEVLLFDDTIEHELYNDSEVSCVALVLDVWNPLLDAEDRDIARTFAAALESDPGI